MSSSNLSGWNVEVPGNRRGGSNKATGRNNSWGGEAAPSRSYRLSPKAQQNHGNVQKQYQRGSRERQDPPIQLTNIKKQWDVQRDIPSGTVRNNPFVPKTDPAHQAQPPSPQLVHQKRQWDTSGIQRGSVAARAMSMESDIVDDALVPSPSSRTSPQMQQHHQRFDRGRSLSSSSGPSQSSTYSRTSQMQRQAFPFETRKGSSGTNTNANVNTNTNTNTHRVTAPPASKSRGAPAVPSAEGGSTSLRGRLIENPFLSAPPVGTASKWEPSTEIPPGAVKRKANRLFTTHVPQWQHGKAQDFQDDESHDEDEDEDDPWIIPSKRSAPTQVFPGNWGEAVPVKSLESDDWDSSAADWFKSSESQTTLSENVHTTKQQSNRNRARHLDQSARLNTSSGKPVSLGILEEKKLDEEGTIPSESHQSKAAIPANRQKVKHEIAEDPFGTTHARDEEILHAARQKSKQAASTTRRNQSRDNIDVLDVFTTTTDADDHGFPADLFDGDVFPSDNKTDEQLDFQFPTSPFGANSAFDDFSMAGKEDNEDLKLDTEIIDRKLSPVERQQQPCQKSKAKAKALQRGAEVSPGSISGLSTFRPSYGLEQDEEQLESHRKTLSHREASDEEDYSHKKERKKGFFTKLFGGARKTKSNTPKVQSNERRSIASTEKNKLTGVGLGTYNVNRGPDDISDKPRHSTTGRQIGPLGASRQPKYEDETTVSTMTAPTAFHENSKMSMDTPVLVPRGGGTVALQVDSKGSPDHFNDNATGDRPNQSKGHVDTVTMQKEPRQTMPDDFNDNPAVHRPSENPAGDTEKNTKGNSPNQSQGRVDTVDIQEELRPALPSPPPPPPPPPRRLEQRYPLHRELAPSLGICDQSLNESVNANTIRQPNSLAGSVRFNQKVKEFRKNGSRHQISSIPSKKINDKNPDANLSQPTSQKTVPTFVTRHARTKFSKPRKDQAETTIDSNNMPACNLGRRTPNIGSLGQVERKFPKASKAFQLSKSPQAAPSIKINDRSIGKRKGKADPANSSYRNAIPSDGSGHSHRTLDTSSVGSDIRILRNILRRPRNEKIAPPVTRPNTEFAAYDEKSITDPMQRAGLRLLSAAIIPIQTEVRRFLAMRRALTRMWALIVIQSHARRWIAKRHFREDLRSIVTVQSRCRGYIQRNDLVYKHICAIEIQRFVRGYLSTMLVYEDIYKVTIVQSHVRMKLAVEEATNRMALVIQLQSVARGFLVRRRLEYREACAVAIQANWRCFFTRLTYQFDLLDIIIVQSAWRRKMAITEVEAMRSALHNYSATIIQSKWRSHDHKNQYLSYRSARLIQSIARCFIGRAAFLRYKSARQIQAAVRSFFCRLAFKRYRSATTIQAISRVFMCRRAFKRYRSATAIQATARAFRCRIAFKRYRSATTIQAMVRAYRCRTSFLRYRSATIIQTRWRSYDCTMNYLHYLADVLIVQSTVRRFLVLKRVQKIRNDAAAKIQSVWRGFVCYADYMFSIADIVVVQKMVRSWIAGRRLLHLRCTRQSRAAVVLQRSWRKFMYARRIQRAWRLLIANRKRNQAALTIQKCWRCFVDETEFVVMKYEYYAARTIQAYWRRFWCFSNFIIALDCSIQIQAAYRGFNQRQGLRNSRQAATLLQSMFRVLLTKNRMMFLTRGAQIEDAAVEVCHLERFAAVVIQSNFRASQARIAVKAYCASRRIQSFVRGRQARVAVRLYVCARAIQAAWRAVTPRRVFVSYISARKIQATWRAKRMQNVYLFYCAARKLQSFWRSKRLRNAYIHYRAARIIQTLWRCKRMHAAYRCYRAALLIQTRFRAMKARRDVLVLRGESLAATLIQCAWRGFVCYTDYIFTVSDIISAQKTARRYLAQKKYKGKIQERLLQRAREMSATVALQKIGRGFIARQRYWYVLGCTMQIQSWVRGRFIVLRFRREACARVKLQCFARRCLARQEYLQRKFILVLLRTADHERTKRVAAMVIQERCRGYLEVRKRDEAARVIQRFFLMVKREVDRLVKATKRRKNWRRKMRNRDDKVEDALLEDAWASAIGSHPSTGKSALLAASSSQDSGPNENIQANTQRSIENEPARGSQLKSCLNYRDIVADPRNKLPPRHSDKPSSVVRLNHDDERSEFSGLTASTANFARPSLSRMKRLGTREMDDDLELEEAFIDAEIFSAKERKIVQARAL